MAVTFNQLKTTPEYKNHLIQLFGIQLFSISLFVIFVLFVINKIEKNFDDQIYAISGIIHDYYPEANDDIVSVITHGGIQKDIDNGIGYLEVYGYDPSISFFRKPFSRSIKLYFSMGILIILVLLSGINFLVFNNRQKSLFGKIDNLSNLIMEILEGRFSYAKDTKEEGLWSQFTCRFNQMLEKIQIGTEHLNKEKIFLKKTISDISHQLKTPLASLIMYNDLMVNNPDIEKEIQNDFLSQCTNQLSRMEWLIKSLLKLARLETGTFDFKKQTLELIDILREVCNDLIPITANRKIKIDNTCSIFFPIKGDPDWLYEAFSNILKNAYQHTDKNGKIVITLSSTPLFLRVSILDNGDGISTKDLPRIFERFYKGSSSTNMNNVGIGLSLSKMIFEGHEANIRVESKKNCGTEFIITFPY